VGLADPVVLLTPPLKNESSFSNNSSFYYMLIGVNGKIRKLYKELDRLNSATSHTVEQ